MPKKGWISLHRKIQDCIIWTSDEPFDRRSAWIDLLLSATHEDTEILFNGKMLEVTKGQLITSVRGLAQNWHWGKDKVLAYLRLLEKLKMITRKSDSHKTLINIENYCIYQSTVEDAKRQLTDTEQTQSRHRQATFNKKNNENNINTSYLLEESSLSESVKGKVKEWLEYKKERRESYKETGLKSLITQISNKEKEFGSKAVIDVIDLSMSNQWKGIIWDKLDKKKNTQFHQYENKQEFSMSSIEEMLLRQ